MGDVVDLSVITTLPQDPDRLLQKAIGQLDRVLIIGIDKDGGEYFASSDPDGGTCIWDMERAKLKLLRLVDTGIDR
jgi:hypothetical protein